MSRTGVRLPSPPPLSITEVMGLHRITEKRSSVPLFGDANKKQIMKKQGLKITDSFTGYKPSGEFALRDDIDEDRECPICGAEIGQQCSEADPENEGMAIELGRYVHIDRIS